MERAAIGVDLGGTNLRWAVVRRTARSCTRRARRGRTAGGDRPARSWRRWRTAGALPESGGRGGRGPGGRRGAAVTSNNLGWLDFPPASLLHAGRCRSSWRTTWPRARWGSSGSAGRAGFQNMIFLTVSTGIGAGIILNGEVYRGADGLAGEVGHMVVDLNGLLCGCGRRGCWEMIASGTAHRRRIREAFSSGTWPNLEREPTPEEVTDRARQGDRAARALVLRTARYLGDRRGEPGEPVRSGSGDLHRRLRPEQLGPHRTTTCCRRSTSRRSAQTVQLLLTELGDDAGVVGAAALALQAAR